MKIGNKLKQGRMDRNMTQEEVANILNVSRSTISSWEVNRTYPDLELLVALSDLYDISLDIILREDQDMVQSLTKDINASRKRKIWLIILFVIYIPFIIFFALQLLNTIAITSLNQVDLLSLEGFDVITFIMLGSLLFGLIAWILPILSRRGILKNDNSSLVSVLSVSACSTAIGLQIVYVHFMVNRGDLAGLMDTIGAITMISIILLLGTLMLNVKTVFYEKES